MSARDRRALTLGALAILAAVLGLRGMPWVWGWVSRSQAELAARRELLAVAETDLGALSELQDSAKQLTDGVVGLAPSLLSGASQSEAAAALSGHLSHLALTHSAKLERTDPVPDSSGAGDLGRVTMDGVFESDVRGLAGLLAALASGQPVTQVTRLRVTAADPATPPRGAEILRIEVRVQAWYLDREAT